uniref:uncharacterized protein LOC120328331 n=1 Tax=Styela clava TaxID=7725 RepID=UPI00193931A7|nr:uncharacterized protein LOC120328331 [Styela clava]
MSAVDINSDVLGRTPQPRIWIGPETFTEDIQEGEKIEEHYAMSWTKTVCIQDEHMGIFEALAITFGVAIFITNFVVVAAIKRGGRKLHKATFYCICNLAVADMLAGLLLLWVFGLQRAVLPFRTAQSELVQKSVWTLTVWSSLMSQVVIAVDRYRQVTRGAKGDASYPRGDRWGNKQRKRMIIAGIIITWLFPTVSYVIPVMTTWNCSGNCSCYFKNNNTDVIYMTCLPLTECSQVNPPFTKANMLFMSLVLLLLPFIPVILYIKIFIFVRKSSKNLYPSTKSKNGHIVVSGSYTDNGWLTKRGTEDSHAHYSKEESSGSKTEAFLSQDFDHALNNERTTNGHSIVQGNSKKFWRRGLLNGKNTFKPQQNGGNVQDPSCDEITSKELTTKKSSKNKSASSNNAQRKRSQRRDMRLLRTLVIILALFVISTVPLGILFLVSVTETDKRYVKAAKYLLTLSLLNSLINPWVYFWRFREMRDAIKRLFCSPCTKRNRAGRRRDDETCGCCNLPGTRKMSIFSSNHSTKKGTSSSSSSAF